MKPAGVAPRKLAEDLDANRLPAYYHWSPRDRRKSIEHDGLVPGKLSVAREWRPPYVCFSDSPSLAWALSGAIHPEVEAWDLWTAWGHLLTPYERLIDHWQDSGAAYEKEIRVYHRVFKRDLWWVGERHG